MATFYDWTFRQGRVMDMNNINVQESEKDHELYVRARDAAQEAQRQADEQLRVAMEASNFSKLGYAGTPESGSMLLCSFPLKFNAPGLEEAYWKKCCANSSKDYVPVACLIVFCMLLPTTSLSRHWLSEMVYQSLNLQTSGNLLWHMFAVVLCSAVLVVQLGFSKWYQSNRGNVLLGFASVLWIWGSLKLFLVNNLELSFSFPVVLIQCIFMSILYRVPFCIHIFSRALGMGMQIFAILAKGSNSEAPFLLLLLFVGHTVGIIIAFVLDRECGFSFFNSLSQLLLNDVTQSGPREQLFRLPLLKQVPNLRNMLSGILNLKVTKKKELDEPIHQKAVLTNAPRRALGGFAGGFCGVSGLKSNRPPVITNTTISANNSSSKIGFSDTSFADSWPYSLGVFISPSADNNVDNILSTSVGSCSCVDSDSNLHNQIHSKAI